MRSSNLFITIIFEAVFVAVLVMQASCAVPPSTGTPIASPADARDGLTEYTDSQANTDELVFTTREPDAVQGTPLLDGLIVLKSRCSMCHVPEWFDEIEKSPAEWEAVLERMKLLGVQLSDAEKDILLDYLIAADKP